MLSVYSLTTHTKQKRPGVTEVNQTCPCKGKVEGKMVLPNFQALEILFSMKKKKMHGEVRKKKANFLPTISPYRLIITTACACSVCVCVQFSKMFQYKDNHVA